MSSGSGMWTHDGANYAIRVEIVQYVIASDEADKFSLTFHVMGGASMTSYYDTRRDRDLALRMFLEFSRTT